MIPICSDQHLRVFVCARHKCVIAAPVCSPQHPSHWIRGTIEAFIPFIPSVSQSFEDVGYRLCFLSRSLQTHQLDPSNHYLRVKVCSDGQTLVYVPKLEEDVSDVVRKHTGVTAHWGVSI